MWTHTHASKHVNMHIYLNHTHVYTHKNLSILFNNLKTEDIYKKIPVITLSSLPFYASQQPKRVLKVGMLMTACNPTV